MKVCKDCVHTDACAMWKNSEIDGCSLKTTLEKMKQEEACDLFETKVIKCKECKYFSQDVGGGKRPGFCTNPHLAIVTREGEVYRYNCVCVPCDGYCIFAEVKSDEC